MCLFRLLLLCGVYVVTLALLPSCSAQCCIEDGQPPRSQAELRIRFLKPATDDFSNLQWLLLHPDGRAAFSDGTDRVIELIYIGTWQRRCDEVHVAFNTRYEGPRGGSFQDPRAERSTVASTIAAHPEGEAWQLTSTGADSILLSASGKFVQAVLVGRDARYMAQFLASGEEIPR